MFFIRMTCGTVVYFESIPPKRPAAVKVAPFTPVWVIFNENYSPQKLLGFLHDKTMYVWPDLCLLDATDRVGKLESWK